MKTTFKQCLSVLLCCALFAIAAGCEPQWIEVRRASEQPIANVPLKLRQTNWTDKAGSGSCVIASSASLLNWHGEERLAKEFKKLYAGGQTSDSIKRIWNKHKIPFEAEENGRPEFLERVSEARHAAIIWFFPNHCVTFCGFGRNNGQEVAWLLDNNRTERFIPVEKREFIRAWRGFGGFAMATTLPPVPFVPFDGYRVSNE
jgi:hypothetical protein